MRSCAVMILLILLGCASVGVDSDKQEAHNFDDVFMAEERQALGISSNGVGHDSSAKAVEEINQNFLAWMTLQSFEEDGDHNTPIERAANNNRLFSQKPVLQTARPQEEDSVEESILNHSRFTLAPRKEDIDKAWESEQKQQVKIGVLLPVSGSLSKIGLHLWRAALLALHQYQSEDHVALHLFDTAGDPAVAEDAFQKALQADVDVILGPFLSSSLEAIRDLVVADVPVLSFSNNNQYAGKGVYIFGYTPLQQLAVLIDYAQHKGKKKLGVLLPKTLYGREIKRALALVLQKEGMSYEDILVYDPLNMEDDTALKTFTDYNERRYIKNRALNLARQNNKEEEIARLEKRDTLGEVPFDSLLLVAGSDINLRTLGAKLSFFDVDRRNGVQFLGLQSWEDFEDLNREPSLIGSWYVAPPHKNRKIFEEAFQKFYKEEPLRLAVLAFELVLLVNSFASEILAGVELSEALESESGFSGVEGHYRFLDNGYVERMMDILRLTHRGETVEQPAIPSFELWDRQNNSLLQEVATD